MSDNFLSVIEAEGHTCILRVYGELDSRAAPELSQALERILGDVTIDLSEVWYMDSSAIEVLVAAHRRAEGTRRRFVLRGVQPNQQKVLDICGFSELFVMDDGATGSAVSSQLT